MVMSGARKPSRDRRNQQRLVKQGHGYLGANLLTESREIGQMCGADPDLQARRLQRDPGDKGLAPLAPLDRRRVRRGPWRFAPLPKRG